MKPTRGHSLTLLFAAGLVTAMIAAGCSSTFDEPENEDSTLVVAKYSRAPGDFDDPDSFLQNIYGSWWVELRVKNDTTGGITMIGRVDDSQLLIGDNLSAGTYLVTNVWITGAQQEGATLRITITEPFVLRIRSGFVNNLGEMQLDFLDNQTVDIQWLPNHDDIRNEFADLHPESSWINLPWLEHEVDYE